MKKLFFEYLKKIKKIPIKKAILAGGLTFFVGLLVFLVFYGHRKIFIDGEKTLKIGVVTDFEYGYKKKIGNKLTNIAPQELEKAVNYFNNEFKPEIVVEVGDMVESSLAKKNTTLKQFGEINEVFSRLEAKRAYVFGNHDLRNLNKEELRNILGLEDNHAFYDLGDWRLIVLDSNFQGDGKDMGPTFYAGAYISREELLWLEGALKTDRPTIIFAHHPPFPVKNKNIANGQELIDILEKNEQIILIVSGHVPNFQFNQNKGVNYLTVDNLANIDSVGSFATLEAKFNRYTKKVRIEIEHYGPTRKSEVIEKDLNGCEICEKINLLY